jgi:hypothetical protein
LSITTPDEARRIAANVAKLPRLKNQVRLLVQMILRQGGIDQVALSKYV